MFGGGPESTHAGALAAVGYVVAVIACLVAPVAGFIFNSRGKTGRGVTTAWVPVAGALTALVLPAHYSARHRLYGARPSQSRRACGRLTFALVDGHRRRIFQIIWN